MQFLCNSKILKFISYKERNSLKKLVIILLFTNILELLSIGIVLPLILYFLDKDNLIAILKNYFFFDFLDKNNLLEVLVFLLVLIFLLKNIFIYLSFQYQARLLRQIKINFTNYIYKKYLLADYSVFLKNTSSIILRNLNEANNFSLVVYSYTTFISEIILLNFFLFFLFWNDWKIALIILLLIFCLAIPIYFFYKKNFKKWTIDKQNADFIYNQTVIESIASIKEIKIYNVIDYFSKVFKNITSHQSFLLYKIDIALQVPKIIVEVFFIFLILLIIYFSLFFNYSLAQTVSTLTLIVLIAVRAMPMTTRLIAALQRIKLGKENVNLLFNIIQDLDLKHSKDSGFLNEDINDFKKIEFNNVSYKYENSKVVLDKLSFTIVEKNIFGIFGKSGSGKSTILNLITGLLTPQSGVININEKNLMNCIRSWRSMLGYVPQSVYLLNDSILRNITIGTEKDYINFKKIYKSIDLSELRTFVDSLPLKIDTIVGENGLLISGGQKQRLGIARALYKSSKILILDEPTSFLDNSLEDNIIKTINHLKKDITIILISHNTKFKKICDSYIDLDTNY